MYKLNKKLADLVPYEAIQGEYRIRLDANESAYNLPEEIRAKICEKVMSLDFNRYPDPYAKNAVKAFAEYYGVLESMVTAGNGSDELISIITSTFLETGDKVVTLSNDFSMYSFYSDIYETKPLVFRKNDDLTFDVSRLADFCNENNAKMLIFSNPCNPTSLGLTRVEVRELLEKVKCLVVLDEAYMDFWDESMLGEIDNYDNVIILKTCSKAVGMAGIRLGFAVAGTTITTAMRAVKSPYNTDSFSQMAGEVIFAEKTYLTFCKNEIISERNKLYEALCLLANRFSQLEKVYETVTNFVFVRTKLCNEIYEKMLEKSIAIRKFNGFIRISAGTADETAQTVKALTEILEELNQ